MNRVRSSPGALFVNLLGGFRVAAPRAENTLILERKKTRALLAVLAVDPKRMVSRARLTTLLWADQNEDVARHGLRQCLLDLRHALASGKVEAIRAEADLIGLEPSRVVVDVEQFERLAGQGTADGLNEAARVYQGDLLEGFSLEEQAFEEWLRVERERLRSRAVEVLRKLLADHVHEKLLDPAIHIAARLLTLEPYDETAHRTLMRLYAESGRRSSALRQYEICVELLNRELGVEPEAETRELYRRLVSERGGAAKTAAITRTPPKRTSRAVRAPSTYPSPAPTPLIGRETDVAWLEALWKGARRGEPQLALVIGEAGIGKSRFVGELTARHEYRHASLLLGRGREGEDVLAFAPWVEALRPILSDDLIARLSPMTRLDLARLFPEIADRSGPVPSAVVSSGIEEGLRIFEAVAELLRLVTGEHPLVVVIEDLHWCDDMTVRLLRFLPRRLKGQPVLLVGTARAEEIGARGGRGAVLEAIRRDGSCASMTLGPLSRDHATDLFQRLLASRDAYGSTLAERVWQLSEGNPFVVGECARAVRERGPATSSVLLDLPDQVRALTDRYLTDLGESAARLADAAAVVGRDFDTPVLQHATGLTPSEVAAGLEELVRRRVVRELGGRFDFGHDRVREAVYGRLLGPRRTLLHHQVAQALETVYATDLTPHYSAVGTHYRHAAAWTKACDYLTRAGYQARERGAGREALACFEDALQALTQIPDTVERTELRVRLHLSAHAAIVMTTSPEQGRAHLHDAEKLADSLPDRRWAGRVAAALSYSYRPSGEFAHARSHGQRALDVARETGDHWLDAVARLVLGSAEYNCGNFRQSVEHLAPLLTDQTHDEDVAERFFPLVDTVVAMRDLARRVLSPSLAQLGELDAAMRLAEQWLREKETASDPLGTGKMVAYGQLSRVHFQLGDFGAAVKAAEASLALYRHDCHRHLYLVVVWTRAQAYAMQGRVREAVELVERTEAAEREIGAKAFRERLLLTLGRVRLEAGRVDDAARAGNEALSIGRDQSNRVSEATAHALLADVASRREPVAEDEMQRRLQTALTLAEALEMRPLIAWCHQRLAWLCERIGNRAEEEQHRAMARSLIAQISPHMNVDAPVPVFY